MVPEGAVNIVYRRELMAAAVREVVRKGVDTRRPEADTSSTRIASTRRRGKKSARIGADNAT